MVTLLPAGSDGYGELSFRLCAFIFLVDSTVESIIDSILKSMPEYLKKNGAQFQVKSVENMTRSCEVSVTDSIVNGYMKYTAGTCINITNLVTTVSLSNLYPHL